MSEPGAVMSAPVIGLASWPVTGNDWPVPANFSRLDVNHNDPEPCKFILRDGKLVSGFFVGFRPGESAAYYLPSTTARMQKVPFADIRIVRLPRAVALKSSAALEGVAGLRPENLQAVRPFTLDFSHGPFVTGNSAGFVRQEYGVYLFPEADAGAGTYERWFVPTDAIGNFSMGDVTGKILVAEQVATETQIRDALELQRESRERPLGEYLTESKVLSQDQLDRALALQRTMPVLRLGDALQELGMLSKEQLEQALERQRSERNRPLGQILVDMGVVTDVQIKNALARKLGIPFVDLKEFQPAVAALSALPPAVAIRHQILPLSRQDQDLVVAMEDPLDQTILQNIRVLTNLRPVPVMATEAELQRRIQEIYGNGAAGLRRLQNKEELSIDTTGVNFTSASTAMPFDGRMMAKDRPRPKEGRADKAEIGELATKLFEEGTALELVSAGNEASGDGDTTLVKLINRMIEEACEAGASDIHIETNAGKANTRVRFRRDGVMVDYLQVPASFRATLLSRIKVMATLDITERKKPQDGKFAFKTSRGQSVELRVATIPTNNGLENVVMRILAGADVLPLDKLGMQSQVLAATRRMVEHTHGLILVCGPTGSGKTTALHSLLGHINDDERKIWTAEDPIEITQEGLCQVQVNPQVGWTFAAALRAFLRADPDVIMVGEMRDVETAKAGIEASLTGHLVMSTLHTNSSPESVTRLLDLGMDPFNFADALVGVLSQRLVRKLCTKCRRPHIVKDAELHALAEEYSLQSRDPQSATPLATQIDDTAHAWLKEYGKDGKLTLFSAAGCPDCRDSGYRGRIAVHELLVNTPEMRRMIQSRAPAMDIARLALDQGMLTLKQDGLLKALAGETDPIQVRAACG